MNILITGTSSGVGSGLAAHYLKEEHKVFGISRNTNTELDNNALFSFLSQDLSNFSEVKKNIPSFVQNVSCFDLVILNAGILSKINDLKDTPLDDIQHVMNINVWANKILIDVLFQEVNEIKQVVAISSGAAVSGSRGWNAYSLSKATLNMLIKLYAKEQPDTHFCSLAPGLIDTRMQDYLNSVQEDDKYPTLKILKAARGTHIMPNPDQAAIAISKANNKVRSFESGCFVDIRDL